MKKTLLAFGAAFIGFASSAQVDTLTSHFNAPATFYIIDNAAPIDSGFICGNNMYGDLAKMQLFDSNYGVTSGGTITSVLVAIPIKAGTGTISVSIWADNAGAPDYANALGTATVDLANIDTTAAAFDALDANAVYNVAVNFASAIQIPSGNKFWAGVVLPDYQTGLISLSCTDVNVTEFAAAATHTGEIQSSGSFFTFNNGTTATWQLNAALAIFPVVNLVVGLEENAIEAAVYPNPATEVLNVKASEEVATINVFTAEGKVVATSASSSVNVAGLNAGVYIYEAVTASGKIARGNFVKK